MFRIAGERIPPFGFLFKTLRVTPQGYTEVLTRDAQQRPETQGAR
jgi:hypothetical protein